MPTSDSCLKKKFFPEREESMFIWEKIIFSLVGIPT
jgi:hypothetical protein